ncbi:MAG: ABC transporter permease [Johnsonella sp.]|nr:ABC transporter permease [Johnsonella sp.]
MKNKINLNKYGMISVLSLLLGIFIWWLLTGVLGIVKSNILPEPGVVVRTFIKKLYDPNPDGSILAVHLMSSLQVALSGYGLGILIGIPLGIIMAWYPKIEMTVRPLFDLVRTVPGVAWIPVMVSLAGIGLLSKALVIFISAMVAAVINTYSGIKQTKEVHLWVGQTFGASNWELLTQVAIPSALPMIMTGCRIALGSAWTTLVAAELLASTRGIGYMIQQARGIYRLDIVIVGMIVIGTTGSILAGVISLVENHMLKGGKY